MTESHVYTSKFRSAGTRGGDASLFNEVVSEVLQKHYGPVRGGRKIVAQIAQASHRTVENWFNGRRAPKALELIRLMDANRELAHELMRGAHEALGDEAAQ